MSMPGYVDYQRREYCKDVSCPIQILLDKEDEGSDAYGQIRQVCKDNCISTTYDFHHWLIEKDYLIIKENKEE